jgi:hypothetical protein
METLTAWAIGLPAELKAAIALAVLALVRLVLKSQGICGCRDLPGLDPRCNEFVIFITQSQGYKIEV